MEHATDRITRLERAIDVAVTTAPVHQRAVIEALQALPEIALVSAVTIVAEVGQLSRFAKPPQLMGYGGVVAREDSSAPRIRRGGSRRRATPISGGSSAKPRGRVATGRRWGPRCGNDKPSSMTRSR